MCLNIRSEVIVSVYCAWCLTLSPHHSTVSLCRFLEMGLVTTVDDACVDDVCDNTINVNSFHKSVRKKAVHF